MDNGAPMGMTSGSIVVVPANEMSCADIAAIFATHAEPARCQCQWFKSARADFQSTSPAERADRLREQTDCGDARSATTSGLVASIDGEPAGWCAVEPRTAYVRLRTARTPWLGRNEDKDDPDVWAVTCFVTRGGFRRRGVGHALARATVDHARERGARAVEGYALDPAPGEQLGWGELYVGSRGMFEAAGYVEVARPSTRRVVMRIDFD